MKRQIRQGLTVLAVFLFVTLTMFYPNTGQAQDLETARVEIANRLVEMGLTQEEAQARVNSLTDQDLNKLIENQEQLAIGGVKDKEFWIIIAVIAFVVPILILVVAF